MATNNYTFAQPAPPDNVTTIGGITYDCYDINDKDGKLVEKI